MGDQKIKDSWTTNNKIVIVTSPLSVITLNANGLNSLIRTIWGE
jgi:hypothetical protein